MSDSMTLSKNSLGVGDRFAHQASAQLKACMLAAENGVTVVPVWNKSNREHNIIGSEPPSVRAAADRAVAAQGGAIPIMWMPITLISTPLIASWYERFLHD